MAILFWASLVALAYTFFGYSALMEVLARWFPADSSPPSGPAPTTVSVVLVVYNGQQQIRERVENLLAQDSPLEEIIVVSDGSDDGTEEILAQMREPKLRLISGKARSGKSACLGFAVREAKGEIIVFADVRQQFEPDTVSQLIGSFVDERVGAVSGALEIQASASSVGKGVGSYWSLEKRLRHAEARFDSSVGCTGAVYAIRKALFEPIPPDTLLDDVVIPMQIAAAGYRVLFNPSALAFDPQPLEPDKERVRKKRTLAGNFQMLFRYPAWMTPWGNRLWWQLISHKYLRIFAPFFLAVALLSPYFLWDKVLYRWAFGLQTLLYLSGILGALPSLKRFRLFSFPASFLFLNGMALRGLWHYLSGTDGAWERVAEPGKDQQMHPGR